jgi:hypothetical protein
LGGKRTRPPKQIDGFDGAQLCRSRLVPSKEPPPGLTTRVLNLPRSERSKRAAGDQGAGIFDLPYAPGIQPTSRCSSNLALRAAPYGGTAPVLTIRSSSLPSGHAKRRCSTRQPPGAERPAAGGQLQGVKRMPILGGRARNGPGEANSRPPPVVGGGQSSPLLLSSSSRVTVETSRGPHLRFTGACELLTSHKEALLPVGCKVCRQSQNRTDLNLTHAKPSGAALSPSHATEGNRKASHQEPTRASTR